MPGKKKFDRKKEKKKKKEDRDSPRAGLKEKVTEMLELPKEIVLNVPKLTMVGNRDLMIENYKGIIEYDDCRVRVNTGVGVVKICGAKLTIREITSEDIMVSGEICSLEFAN